MIWPAGIVCLVFYCPISTSTAYSSPSTGNDLLLGDRNQLNKPCHLLVVVLHFSSHNSVMQWVVLVWVVRETPRHLCETLILQQQTRRKWRRPTRHTTISKCKLHQPQMWRLPTSHCVALGSVSHRDCQLAAAWRVKRRALQCKAVGSSPAAIVLLALSFVGIFVSISKPR